MLISKDLRQGLGFILRVLLLIYSIMSVVLLSGLQGLFLGTQSFFWIKVLTLFWVSVHWNIHWNIVFSVLAFVQDSVLSALVLV